MNPRMTLPDWIIPQIHAYMNDGLKIQAIKLVRSETEWSLVNSKKAVELIAEGKPVILRMEYTDNGYVWKPLPSRLEVSHSTILDFRSIVVTNEASAFQWRTT